MLGSVGDVPTPRYDRATVTTGIVHFGVGGFHRAHQAFYVDQLLASDPSWGICGVGVRPADARMRDALVPQDGLYTLTLKHPDGAVETSVIGSIVEYLYAPDDPEAVLEKLADPAVRIVSLTVTEAATTSRRPPASSMPTTRRSWPILPEPRRRQPSSDSWWKVWPDAASWACLVHRDVLRQHRR